MVNVGVIGCGYWGPNLIRNFCEIPGAKVIACCDFKTEKLDYIKSKYSEIQTVGDHKVLLENPDIQAIVIATPIQTHFKLAKEALTAGKHVLVEKPLCISSAEARELVDLAKAKGLVLMVGHTFEYNGAIYKLKELVESGELGQIFYVNSTRANLGLFQEKINVIWDLAPHDISILIYVLGLEPLNVTANGSWYIQKDIEDVVYLTIGFPDRILAHIHVSWLDPCKIRRTTIVGSKKMVVYDDNEPMEKIKIYDKGVLIPSPHETFGEFELSYRYGDVIIPRLELAESLKTECRHFLECIEENKKCRSDGSSGLKVVKVLEAAQRSLDNNSRLEVL